MANRFVENSSGSNGMNEAKRPEVVDPDAELATMTAAIQALGWNEVFSSDDLTFENAGLRASDKNYS